MFTLQQIQQAAGKVKTGADFPQLVQDFKALGVRYADTYVTDGHTVYEGDDEYSINTDADYAPLPISQPPSVDKLKKALQEHQQGRTNYPTFCTQAAEAGVHKWTTDMIRMRVSYQDPQGNMLLTERIPEPVK